MFTGTKVQTGQANPSVEASTAQISKLSNVNSADSATIHVNFSTPNSGTLTVQARNIETLPNEPNKAWYDLSFGGPAVITAETNVQILLNALPFYEIRLVWTPSAGAGTMSAFLNTKVSGA
jgi:hypothetical protein